MGASCVAVLALAVGCHIPPEPGTDDTEPSRAGSVPGGAGNCGFAPAVVAEAPFEKIVSASYLDTNHWEIRLDPSCEYILYGDKLHEDTQAFLVDDVREFRPPPSGVSVHPATGGTIVWCWPGQGPEKDRRPAGVRFRPKGSTIKVSAMRELPDHPWTDNINRAATPLLDGGRRIDLFWNDERWPCRASLQVAGP